MLRLYWLARNNPFVVAIFIIVFIVISFYFSKFHYGLSEKNEVWGSFGDYFGGILNPVIAGFAFYLIRETYVLQKKELEETRDLLKVSTDAQKNQIKLAALTALINSNLTRISFLESERISLLQGTLMEPNGPIKLYSTEYFSRKDKIESAISNLQNMNYQLDGEIRGFL